MRRPKTEQLTTPSQLFCVSVACGVAWREKRKEEGGGRDGRREALPRVRRGLSGDWLGREDDARLSFSLSHECSVLRSVWFPGEDRFFSRRTCHSHCAASALKLTRSKVFHREEGRREDTRVCRIVVCQLTNRNPPFPARVGRGGAFFHQSKEREQTCIERTAGLVVKLR